MKREELMADTRSIARDLLGMEIIRTDASGVVRAVITETEAYYGFQDKASHAARGRTARTEPMFARGGVLYVYLIYGMHHCLNIVTEREGYPAAVLIRGIRVLPEGILVSGPGRVTKALRIDRSLNMKDMFADDDLRFGARIEHPKRVARLPRIGVDYAGEWAHKRLRFLIQ